MTIKSLKIENLGAIRRAMLDDRAPVVLVYGRNEQGKSTVLDALHVLYFGTRPGLDVKDNAALVHEGARGWSVELLDVDPKTGAENTLRATRSQRPRREECEAVLGDARAFAATTRLDGFLDMTPAARRELLADLMAKGTAELVAKLEAEGVADEVLAPLRAGNQKRAHAVVVDRRRASDRRIKELEARMGQDVPDPEVETVKGTKKLSEIPLDAIERSLELLSRKRDEALSASHATQDARTMIEAGKRAEAWLAEHTEPPAWSDEDAAALNKAADDLEKVRQDAMRAGIEATGCTRKMEDLRALQTRGGNCPTCLTPLEAGAAERLTSAIAECSAKSTEWTTKQAALNEEADALEAARKELWDRREAANTDRSTRGRMQATIEAAKRAAERAGDTSQLEKAQEEVARVTAIRDRVRDRNTMLGMIEQARMDLRDELSRRDTLARHEAMLDPKAVDGEASAVEGLRTRIEEYGKALFGEIAVQLSDDYELTIYGRPPCLASTSAQARAGMACSFALSAMSGLGIAFVDGFERIDAANRKAVLVLLKRLVVEDVLRFVLVAMVRDDETPGGSAPWLAWARVHDGVLEYAKGA